MLLMVWFEALKDLGDKPFAKAIKEILQTCKFFPSIAEIREVAAKHKPVDVALQVPELTPERRANNIKRMAGLIKGLGRRI